MREKKTFYNNSHNWQRWSTTWFSSEEVFPSVRLSPKKLKLFVNDSDSKGNINEVGVTG